jgi:branched-chain amino acid transport system ATP-binding protein
VADAALEVEHVRKSFGGVHAVEDVSFTLPQGEIRALIGPNGAGKTTFFNILSGQLPANAGTVKFRGREIAGMSPWAIWGLGIGRTFQITATFATLTVLENVQVARISHVRKRRVLFRPARTLEVGPATALLEQVGLVDQRQRPAGVLAYGPSLLLLDEPTAGMAPAERGALMALTARIARDRGLTVLFTEHDMDVVFTTADRVMVLYQGRLIAEGVPAEVRAHREVQAVYLGDDVP